MSVCLWGFSLSLRMVRRRYGLVKAYLGRGGLGCALAVRAVGVEVLLWSADLWGLR